MKTPFIKPIKLMTDVNEILTDLDTVLSFTTWEPDNQIGLRHRKNCTNEWKDSSGSLYDKVNNRILTHEYEFDQYNHLLPENTLIALEQLKSVVGKNIGRARFMRLMPKTGLSIHRDFEKRYHLVLKTNRNAILAECMENAVYRSIGYHLPANNTWYEVDTTREHYVYNGGWEPRIHLVVCSC